MNHERNNILNNSTTQISAVVAVALVLAPILIAAHPEPLNALSIPTWVVHTSSLLEWLYAMKLVWEHADVSNNPKWRNLTWAMIPSHTSGICACTYHFFYNTPLLNWVVNLQAGLTCLGNTAFALAAYTIYEYGKNNNISSDNNAMESTESTLPPLEDTDFQFNRDMLLKSTMAAVALKYGELYLDFPFNPKPEEALAIITIPTLLNIGKWLDRSRKLPSSVEV